MTRPTLDDSSAETPRLPARSLALYASRACGFCWRVQSAIDALGAEVEMRYTDDQGEHKEALVEARGRATVPVLRITDRDAGRVVSDVWMPESRDIIAWLQREFG